MKRFPFAIDATTPLYLAPMAGVSESPFRRLCARFGADVVITEFLSAEGIRRENPATLEKLRFGEDERPIGVQIFGAEPEAMGEAARLVTDVFQPVGRGAFPPELSPGVDVKEAEISLGADQQEPVVGRQVHLGNSRPDDETIRAA